jgi:hypothetical protein
MSNTTPDSASNGSPVPGNSAPASDLKTLASRLRQAEPTDELGADFLIHHWQKLLGAVVVLLLAAWIVNQARQSGKRAEGEAGARFAAAQEEFSKLFSSEAASKSGEQEQQNKDRLRAFEDSLSSLKELTAGRSTYTELGGLYEAAAALKQGKLEEAQQKVEAATPLRPAGLTTVVAQQPVGQREFVAELASLLSIRIALAKGGALSPEVREQVVQLARGAQFVNSEAVLLLARFAVTDEEKSGVKALSEEVSVKRAGQGDALSEELKRLGIL